MLFSHLSGSPTPLHDHLATAPALKCLLAYDGELDGCRIEVEVAGGGVQLTGHAPRDAAVCRAIEIVAAFTSMPVFSSIVVAPTIGLQFASPADY